MPSNGHVARSYRLIDSDSHVNEPPDLWQSRVPAAYRDRAPRMEHFEQGDAWVLEGVRRPDHLRPERLRRPARPARCSNGCAGRTSAAGGWDPAARLAEMDTDGVDAQILYPTPRLSHSIIANQDTEFHLALVRAYNDWLGEYCSHAPHRLGGLVMVPNRGIDTAVAEFERAIQLPGMVGALVDLLPARRPGHRAGGRRPVAGGGRVRLPAAHPRLDDQRDARRPQGQGHRGGALLGRARPASCNWSRPGSSTAFPALQVVVTETDCGWVPYVKEQADDRFHRMERGAEHRRTAAERLHRRPLLLHLHHRPLRHPQPPRHRRRPDPVVERLPPRRGGLAQLVADHRGRLLRHRPGRARPHPVPATPSASTTSPARSRRCRRSAPPASGCSVLLADLVATSAAVAATPARSAKTAALAALLAATATGDEIEPAVAWLSGEPRQGKVGVGWATVFSVDVGHAAAPIVDHCRP